MVFFFKQKTAYEMRISDWSSDVCALPILRAVAGCQAPDVLAVPLPVLRVLDRIGALCQRGAAAVLEVVDAARTHVLVLDAAEIDPDLAVLVSELRREAQVFLAFEMPPAAVVGARPRGPRVGLDRVRRRAQGEDVDQQIGRAHV